MEKIENLKGSMMKKNTLIFTLLILMVSEIIYAKDFRNTTWGMTKAQVKQVETGEFYKEIDGRLVYITKLAGYKSLIIYIFVGNKLTRARYSIIEKHTNKNDYISDYDILKDLLNKKYGKPKKDETLWSNDLYKDDYYHWGFAISLGHLMYYASWENDKSNIDCMLSGENYKINTIIEYTSKELEPVEKKENEKKALDDF